MLSLSLGLANFVPFPDNDLVTDTVHHLYSLMNHWKQLLEKERATLSGTRPSGKLT